MKSELLQIPPDMTVQRQHVTPLPQVFYFLFAHPCMYVLHAGMRKSMVPIQQNVNGIPQKIDRECKK